MEDSLDSLDSLFGSVGSPTSQLKSTVADEDKRREARLFRQKQSEEEDVDSLLSELRSARGGKSMARTAANVMDSGSSSSTSPSPTKGRGRRRKDEGGSSMAKDAALFLESGAQERSDRTSTRSRRLGGAAVSWLDSSTPPISTAKVAVDPKRKNFNNDPIVEDELDGRRVSPSARLAAAQALENSSAASTPDAGAASSAAGKGSSRKVSPSAAASSGSSEDVDLRRSTATSFAAQEAMKTAEQARAAKEARAMEKLEKKLDGSSSSNASSTTDLSLITSSASS